jgi:hypothetical protein
MDKLFIKGLDTIFFIIALKAAQKFGVSLSTSHLDSSSMPEVLNVRKRLKKSTII